MAAGDLITLAELKARLETTEDESDTVLGAVITSASAAIAAHTSRDFIAQNASTRTRVARRWGDGSWWIGDTRAVTSIAVTDTDGVAVGTIPGSDVILEPRDVLYGPGYAVRLKSTATTTIAAEYGLVISGDFGWATIPREALEACVMTCRSWIRQDGARWSGVPDVGDGYMVAPTPAATWMLPLAAKQLLQNLRLRGVA